MIHVIAPGLETTVQDFPGRRGLRAVGIPPSGPYDDRSFRIGNALLGNAVSAAGLEIQLIGPTLRFDVASTVALTGAVTDATLDGRPLPMWQTVEVRAGQVLNIGTAVRGIRSYLTIAGGIRSQPVLGSRSTFVRAGIGGIGGRALAAGMQIPIARTGPVPPRLLAPPAVPDFGHYVAIDVVLGPHSDWLTPAGHQAFLDAPWTVTAQSDRTGCRLVGPALEFSDRALNKPPDNGGDPSNVVNTGYPLGGVNLAGTSPIVLPVDGPSQGGFITPYVIAGASMWRLAQVRGGHQIRFTAIDRDSARNRLIEHENACAGAEYLVKVDELTTASGAA
ncbi:biotin-dependent carboxyltransferase family protein [Rhodococcus sp. IEGM 1354]|uniref:5-oxoprolinase subunit C family protein n=1 Tax=Rhodococcus sp. IEGM 1354 TaxID=3047088 RepID=UPI0024B7AA40|nr:biotin-dependent carboxyltransferase family protein [Rhodococcus sp. IEGM 1354]MDI9933768.1 biotin-dependent carboxyltransferase family protein [Rhodococcus sp. IEGM 1354]